MFLFAIEKLWAHPCAHSIASFLELNTVSLLRKPHVACAGVTFTGWFSALLTFSCPFMTHQVPGNVNDRVMTIIQHHCHLADAVPTCIFSFRQMATPPGLQDTLVR
ncbi:hypothetical protein NP493_8414g00000 [Ridgeia piscesae]|uniref:Uncharacterized protein n=1 Tax=Ridgeia piscesae TaxID=27915 RepID=A0AAD9MJA5_RIDPI|nr:hypothetical protein NP493_8414g00000 [Ridgeia piscesae]